jgi:hypothetical protein
MNLHIALLKMREEDKENWNRSRRWFEGLPASDRYLIWECFHNMAEHDKTMLLIENETISSLKLTLSQMRQLEEEDKKEE